MTFRQEWVKLMLENKYHARYQKAYNHGGFVVCKHNEHVNCVGGADCEKCGWNPAVINKRKERLKTFYTDYFKFIKLQRKADIGE